MRVFGGCSEPDEGLGRGAGKGHSGSEGPPPPQGLWDSWAPTQAGPPSVPHGAPRNGRDPPRGGLKGGEVSGGWASPRRSSAPARPAPPDSEKHRRHPSPVCPASVSPRVSAIRQALIARRLNRLWVGTQTGRPGPAATRAPTSFTSPQKGARRRSPGLTEPAVLPSTLVQVRHRGVTRSGCLQSLCRLGLESPSRRPPLSHFKHISGEDGDTRKCVQWKTPVGAGRATTWAWGIPDTTGVAGGRRGRAGAESVEVGPSIRPGGGLMHRRLGHVIQLRSPTPHPRLHPLDSV